MRYDIFWILPLFLLLTTATSFPYRCFWNFMKDLYDGKNISKQSVDVMVQRAMEEEAKSKELVIHIREFVQDQVTEQNLAISDVLKGFKELKKQFNSVEKKLKAIPRDLTKLEDSLSSGIPQDLHNVPHSTTHEPYSLIAIGFPFLVVIVTVVLVAIFFTGHLISTEHIEEQVLTMMEEQYGITLGLFRNIEQVVSDHTDHINDTLETLATHETVQESLAHISEELHQLIVQHFLQQGQKLHEIQNTQVQQKISLQKLAESLKQKETRSHETGIDRDQELQTMLENLLADMVDIVERKTEQASRESITDPLFDVDELLKNASTKEFRSDKSSKSSSSSSSMTDDYINYIEQIIQQTIATNCEKLENSLKQSILSAVNNKTDDIRNLEKLLQEHQLQICAAISQLTRDQVRNVQDLETHLENDHWSSVFSTQSTENDVNQAVIESLRSREESLKTLNEKLQQQHSEVCSLVRQLSHNYAVGSQDLQLKLGEVLKDLDFASNGSLENVLNQSVRRASNTTEEGLKCLLSKVEKNQDEICDSMSHLVMILCDEFAKAQSFQLQLWENVQKDVTLKEDKVYSLKESLHDYHLQICDTVNDMLKEHFCRIEDFECQCVERHQNAIYSSLEKVEKQRADVVAHHEDCILPWLEVTLQQYRLEISTAFSELSRELYLQNQNLGAQFGVSVSEVLGQRGPKPHFVTEESLQKCSDEILNAITEIKASSYDSSSEIHNLEASFTQVLQQAIVSGNENHGKVVKELLREAMQERADDLHTVQEKLLQNLKECIYKDSEHRSKDLLNIEEKLQQQHRQLSSILPMVEICCDSCASLQNLESSISNIHGAVNQIRALCVKSDSMQELKLQLSQLHESIQSTVTCTSENLKNAIKEHVHRTMGEQATQFHDMEEKLQNLYNETLCQLILSENENLENSIKKDICEAMGQRTNEFSKIGEKLYNQNEEVLKEVITSGNDYLEKIIKQSIREDASHKDQLLDMEYKLIKEIVALHDTMKEIPEDQSATLRNTEQQLKGIIQRIISSEIETFANSVKTGIDETIKYRTDELHNIGVRLRDQCEEVHGFIVRELEPQLVTSLQVIVASGSEKLETVMKHGIHGSIKVHIDELRKIVETFQGYGIEASQQAASNENFRNEIREGIDKAIGHKVQLLSMEEKLTQEIIQLHDTLKEFAVPQDKSTIICDMESQLTEAIIETVQQRTSDLSKTGEKLHEQYNLVYSFMTQEFEPQLAKRICEVFNQNDQLLKMEEYMKKKIVELHDDIKDFKLSQDQTSAIHSLEPRLKESIQRIITSENENLQSVMFQTVKDSIRSSQMTENQIERIVQNVIGPENEKLDESITKGVCEAVAIKNCSLEVNITDRLQQFFLEVYNMIYNARQSSDLLPEQGFEQRLSESLQPLIANENKILGDAMIQNIHEAVRLRDESMQSSLEEKFREFIMKMISLLTSPEKICIETGQLQALRPLERGGLCNKRLVSVLKKSVTEREGDGHQVKILFNQKITIQSEEGEADFGTTHEININNQMSEIQVLFGTSELTGNMPSVSLTQDSVSDPMMHEGTIELRSDHETESSDQDEAGEELNSEKA